MMLQSTINARDYKVQIVKDQPKIGIIVCATQLADSNVPVGLIILEVQKFQNLIVLKTINGATNLIFHRNGQHNALEEKLAITARKKLIVEPEEMNNVANGF